MINFKTTFLLSLLAGHEGLPQNKVRRSSLDERGFENPIRETYYGPNSYVTSFGSDISVCDDYESLKNENFRLLDGDIFDSVYFENFPPFDQEEDDFSSASDGNTLGRHVDVTKPVALPFIQNYPFPVHRRIPVPIRHPVLVPYPEPYPIHIEVSEPYAVPVYRDLKIPVEKEVRYPIEKRVPVKIDKPVEYEVEKHQPVYVLKPYPVKIPIVRTIIHKSTKKSGNAVTASELPAPSNPRNQEVSQTLQSTESGRLEKKLECL